MRRRGYEEWDSNRTEDRNPQQIFDDVFADPVVRERIAELIARAALGDKDRNKLN